ncbi:MAG: undecaprenyldiphospho-muramoylpentapeptide beta-N-acetylglucosaminyltransferase [Acidobacteria bacterium]|nr:undecaprenyldiphospho-muramoylpentapeptide beta-N-acetylglucosaminyltransferase [Acidobacteriota bacterium]
MEREDSLGRTRGLKLLVAGGGTGGHVIPALVLATEFRRRDPSRQVLFVGTHRGIETRLVPPAGFPLELLEVGMLQGQPLVVRLKTLLALPRACWQAMQMLDRFRPQVVLGVGGYASGPLMLAAAFRGTPLAVFEPNAFPGLVNRWMAPYAQRAFVNFEEAARYFASGRAIVTGIPVREEFFQVPTAGHHHPFTVLVFGGSQGARSINRAVIQALPRLAQQKPALALLHQTGEREYNRVKDEVANHSAGVEVFAFLDRMWEAFARADLVVCRAGASTVAELAAAGRAAILVPYPAAANQHQLHNAEALERAGAARLIRDPELNGDSLMNAICELMENPERLHGMESAMRRMAHPGAATRIVDELERLANRATT